MADHTTAGIDLDKLEALVREYGNTPVLSIGRGRSDILAEIKELARRSTSGSNKMWAQEELDRAERSIDLMQSDEASGSDGTAAAGAVGLSSLTRYEPVSAYGGPTMKAEPSGDWVQFEDVRHLVAASSRSPVPAAYACPAGCGCMWRDNRDGTMSLFDGNQESCAVCEPLPLAKLEPMAIADHLFIDQRDDGIWLVCVEKVHRSREDAQAACRRWKAAYRAAAKGTAGQDGAA